MAFARVGSKIYLVDATGVLMDLPLGHKKKYSFPVIIGLSLAEPRSTSAPRMRIYDDLIAQLDGGGAHYSQDLSEVDISDPDDVKILVNDPHGAVLVHLGSSNYLERYKIYVSHVQEWRQQFSKLDSVDLRYDNQIVVNPESQGIGRQAGISPSALKAAISAGVQPAVLVSHERTAGKSDTATLTEKKFARDGPAKVSSHQAKVRRAKSVVHAAAKREVVQKHAGQPGTAKTSSPIATTTQTSKKPSPAITKGQERP